VELHNPRRHRVHGALAWTRIPRLRVLEAQAPPVL